MFAGQHWNSTSLLAFAVHYFYPHGHLLVLSLPGALASRLRPLLLLFLPFQFCCYAFNFTFISCLNTPFIFSSGQTIIHLLLPVLPLSVPGASLALFILWFLLHLELSPHSLLLLYCLFPFARHSPSANLTLIRFWRGRPPAERFPFNACVPSTTKVYLWHVRIDTLRQKAHCDTHSPLLNPFHQKAQFFDTPLNWLLLSILHACESVCARSRRRYNDPNEQYKISAALWLFCLFICSLFSSSLNFLSIITHSASTPLLLTRCPLIFSPLLSFSGIFLHCHHPSPHTSLCSFSPTTLFTNIFCIPPLYLFK